MRFDFDSTEFEEATNMHEVLRSGTETCDIIQQAFRSEAMSRSKIFEWYKAILCEGGVFAEDDLRLKRPSISTRPKKK